MKDKCMYCQGLIPKDRQSLLTCKKECSKHYNRITKFVNQRSINKYKKQNIKLKAMLFDATMMESTSSGGRE